MRNLIPILMLAGSLQAAESAPIKLWPSGAPEAPGLKLPPEEAIDKGDGVLRVSNVSEPTITVYQADKPNGTAIVVCPGGGYSILAIDHEGKAVCEALNKIGVTGVLLKYRVPRRDATLPHAAPLQDAQRAMGIVRKRAAEWAINPERIGILGFSAGGNLAVMAGLHPEAKTYTIDPALDGPAHANFMIPVYPAYLVDNNAPFVLKPEIAVAKDSPPVFLVHADDDKLSSSASALLYIEYKKLGIPSELHIYAKGGHGFGMKSGDNPANQWFSRCADWLGSMGYLD